MLKKLFSHTAIYGLVPQVPKLVGVFTLPIITKYLTPVDFGVYGLISAIIASVSVFNLLGLNVALTNYLIKCPNTYKIAWRQIYGFLMIWNIPYCLIVSLIVWLFIPDEAKDNYIPILLSNVIPIILFGPTAILGGYYYQLKQKPFQIAIRGVLFGILGVLLTLWFIAYLKMGYMGWFWSAGITQVLMQLSYWYPVNMKLGLTPIFNFKRRFIRRQLKIGLPTVPHYYGAYLLNTSDRFLMKLLAVPTFDIGLYNAANTVSNLFNLVGTAAGQASGPLMLQAYKKNNEMIVRSLTFILQILFLSGCFLTSIWLKEIFFMLIKNKELASVYPIGIILVMAYSYRPMYLGANNRLFFYERTKSLPKITFVAGLLVTILNFTLIPLYGFKVAAFTTFIGLMYMGYSGYFMKDYKELSTIRFYPLFWLTLTILLTVLGFICVDFPISVKIFISFTLLIVTITSVYKVIQNHR